MMRTLILTSAAIALAAAPALAATNTAAGPSMGQNQSSGNQSSGNESSGTQSSQDMNSPMSGPMGAVLRQKIHHDLSQAGFTDIHVMPRSFLVRAKDSSGNPVMMVINPDSVTAITENQGPSGNQSAQGGSSGAMGTSTMTNSGQSGNAINSPNGNGTTVR